MHDDHKTRVDVEAISLNPIPMPENTLEKITIGKYTVREVVGGPEFLVWIVNNLTGKGRFVPMDMFEKYIEELYKKNF